MLLHFYKVNGIFDFQKKFNPFELAIFIAVLLVSTFGTALLGLLHAFSKENKVKKCTLKFHTFVTVFCFSLILSCFFVEMEYWWVYLIGFLTVSAYLTLLQYFPRVGFALIPVVYWIQFCFLNSLTFFFERRIKGEEILFVELTEFKYWLLTLPLFILISFAFIWAKYFSRALSGVWQVSCITAPVSTFLLARYFAMKEQLILFVLVFVICIVSEVPLIFLAYRKQVHLSQEKKIGI